MRVTVKESAKMFLRTIPAHMNNRSVKECVELGIKAIDGDEGVIAHIHTIISQELDSLRAVRFGIQDSLSAAEYGNVVEKSMKAFEIYSAIERCTEIMHVVRFAVDQK